MALTIGELVAYITAENRGFRRGLSRAERDMEHFQRDANGRLHDLNGRFVREGEDAGRGFGSRLARAAGKAIKAGFGAAGAVLTPLAGLPLTIAAIASTAVAAAPLLAQAGAAVAEFGSSALAAAPALLALFAAVKIAKLSLTALFAEGTAARKALEPLTATFEKATEAGSKAAARGIRPLAEELQRVVQPIVTRYMVGVGRAANIVQKRFLGWAKSSEGLRAIRGILEPISAAMQRLAPKVSKLAISFTAMLGRIMGVSTAAGSKGAAKALDWLSSKLDQVNKASVQGGLNDLAKTFRTIKSVVVTVVGWIQKLVDAYKLYTTEFGLLADAISVAAIIFGGPIAAIIGAVGLIIRHFDQVKAAYEGIKSAFKSPIAGDFFANVKQAGAEILPALKDAFQQIKTEVLPVLQEIWTKIKTQLVPAFGEFLAAAAPVVAWLIGVLAPIVASTFRTVLSIISGTIDIIVGIFKVLTGILTGDWSKCWEGIKQILDGAAQIVVALIRWALSLIVAHLRGLLGIAAKIWSQIWSTAVRAWHHIMDGIKNAVRAGAREVYSAVSGLKRRVLGFFSGAGRWLWNSGKALLDGLIDGIESAVGRLRSKLSSVTNLIPSWKGPMSVDMRLLEPSGAAIMSGLMDGIAGALPALRGLLGGVTGDIAAAVAPTPGAASPLTGPGMAAAAARAVQQVLVRLVLDVEGGEDAFKDVVRGWVRVDGGGDVQAALGN